MAATGECGLFDLSMINVTRFLPAMLCIGLLYQVSAYAQEAATGTKEDLHVSTREYLQSANAKQNEENKTVVEMTPEELRYSYRSECSGIKFDLNQDSLDPLLVQAGNKIVAFFRDFTNTSATERVRLQRYLLVKYQEQPPAQPKLIQQSLPGAASTGQGSSPISGIVSFKERTMEFDYLILPKAGGIGRTWIEDRKDKKGRTVDSQKLAGFIMSLGYAGLSLYLHPDKQPNSRFRYLGRDAKSKGAHVIAFAQKPEAKDYLAEYQEAGSRARLLVQGLVWLDPDSHQILRMRTDMLTPEISTSLKETVTDIRYEKVRFERGGQEFWLPKEINVSWELPGEGRMCLVFRNQHLYSGYHMFAVTSDYSISPSPQVK